MAELGTTLLTLARNAIAACFGQPGTAVVDLLELHEMGATFVTLTQHGQLRGCIGSLEVWRPLLADVQENARSAALRDPRFKPLTAEELPLTRVEVSLLTPAEPISFTSETDALAQLRPDRDGVIFVPARHRSTFLPDPELAFEEHRIAAIVADRLEALAIKQKLFSTIIIPKTIAC